MDSRITLAIIAAIIFVSMGVNQYIYQFQLGQVVENTDRSLERLRVGQDLANIRGNLTSEQNLEAIDEINDLQRNITRTDDIRMQHFVRYLEAESDDIDEELDDLRNITLALVDNLNITIPDETREDTIKFENGVITFDNGTVVDISDIFKR